MLAAQFYQAILATTGSLASELTDHYKEAGHVHFLAISESDKSVMILFSDDSLIILLKESSFITPDGMDHVKAEHPVTYKEYLKAKADQAATEAT